MEKNSSRNYGKFLKNRFLIPKIIGIFRKILFMQFKNRQKILVTLVYNLFFVLFVKDQPFL